MADDLNDDWWTDSHNDGEKSLSPDVSSDSDTAVVKQQSLKKSCGEKRKSIQIQGDGDEEESNQNMVVQPKKKSKRKKISEALSKKTPEPPKYTDLTTAISRHFDGKLAAVEVDEITLSEEHFSASSALADTPTDYLHTILTIPKWKKKVKAMKKTTGAPLLLIVCSAASRAVEVIRDLKKFHRGDCKVAKLFAKHIKIEEQTKYLKRSVIHIGVGTPNRIAALIDDECLSLEQTSTLMLDWSWRDVKLRRLVDIPEIRDDLFKLLKEHFVPHVKNSTAKFALL